MKTKDFNKIGGTESRVSNQVNFYVSFIDFIFKTQADQNNHNLTRREWDVLFKKWAKDEEIYDYKEKDSLNRFDMCVQNIEKDMNAIKEENNIFKIIDEDLLFESPDNYFFQKLQQGKKTVNLAFKELLNFIDNNPEKNDAKKLSHCFMVYDGSETIEELYEINILHQLAENMLPALDKNEMFTKMVGFKKPPTSKEYLNLVYERKKMCASVAISDFKNYDQSNDQYLKKIIFPNKREKFQMNVFIDRINHLTIEEYVIKVLIRRLEALLSGDYFDLFNRWMYCFKISDANAKSGQTFSNKNFEIVNDHMYTLKNIKNKELKFPYTIEETINFLDKIQEKNFSFKYENVQLSELQNSILAEYFVNLFFSYKLGITPKDFTKFANTKVNEELYPRFTAPGRTSDMLYFDDKQIISIETTIHRNRREVINNERYPCLLHLKEAAKKYDKNNINLFFISYLSHDSEVVDQFQKGFNADIIEDNILTEKKYESKMTLCVFNEIENHINYI